MNPGPYVKSLIPAILAVLYSLQSWAATGHLDAPHVRGSLLGLAVAALVYWLPNAPAPETWVLELERPPAPPQSKNDRQLDRRLTAQKEHPHG